MVVDSGGLKLHLVLGGTIPTGQEVPVKRHNTLQVSEYFSLLRCDLL